MNSLTSYICEWTVYEKINELTYIQSNAYLRNDERLGTRSRGHEDERVQSNGY